MTRDRVVFGAFVAASGLWGHACIDRGVNVCELDDQCGPDGVCEAAGSCSYPDPECDSRRRYSEISEFGPVCVDADATSGSTSSETTGASSGPDPEPIPGASCGNAVIDADEICDDGNRANGDGCNSYCVDPGATVWEQTYDSEDHDEDRAYAISVSPSGDTFAVTGVTAVPGSGLDILVQLYRVDTGGLLWTQTHGGNAGGDDSGEEIDFDSAGNIVVVGREVNDATSGDVWLAKFDDQGELLWSKSRDEEGGDDKGQSVAVGLDDSIVVAGHVGRVAGEDEHSDIWIARFDGDGNPIGSPITEAGAAGGSDAAIDVRTDAAGQVYVTGTIRNGDAPSVWTAAYDRNDQPLWTDVFTATDPGSVDRGVGIGLDLDGNVIVAGTAGSDIWIRRYDGNGAPTSTIVFEDPMGLHDEASDAVFAEDGSFVVTGFTGFRTQGFAASDIWVRRYDAQTEELWTVSLDGAAREIDKALAVVGLDDGSVIAAGYVTTPGQLRDVWLRKIAP